MPGKATRWNGGRISILPLLTILALATLIHLAPARAEREAAGLDGTSWKIDVRPDATAPSGPSLPSSQSSPSSPGVKPYEETLIFADGHASFTEAEKSGFAAAAYSASLEDKGGNGDKGAKGGRYVFKTEQSSATEGTAVWTGTVQDKEIEGKMIFTRLDGLVLTYSFKGRKLD